MPVVDESARAVAERLALAMRKRRKAVGLNQEQAAERADMHPKHYQAMESGFSSYRDRHPANPTLDMLRRLAAAYEISVPDLMWDVFGAE